MKPRIEALARQHGIRQKRDDGGIKKTLTAFLRRADEGTFSRLLVEASILLAASRGNLIHEYTREALVVKVERRGSSAKVIVALADVMIMKGVPEHLRSDKGPEFVAHELRKWLAGTGAKTAYIEPGSPWENRYCESFNSKMRDEFLKGEIFYSMKELHVLAECWRNHYNTIRPHSSLSTDLQAQRHGWHRPLGRRILHRSELGDRYATLTIQLVQNIGQARISFSTIGSSCSVIFRLTYT